jgi:parvulin-like peptidyl-prolyl isomerase
MSFFLHRALPLAIALSLSACAGGTSGESAKPGATGTMAPPPDAFVGVPLAKVDGMPVGTAAFEQFSQRQTPADGKAFSMDEKKKILEDAITDEVLFQAAFDKGLYHDPKVRKIMINLLLRESVYTEVNNNEFTDAELLAFFEEHKEEFVMPEKVQVMRLFVAITNVRDDAAALAAAQQHYTTIVANPEEFRAVATEHSDDPFKRRGGDLGYISREGKPGVPPEVTARAFELEVGTVTEPFLAAGGYNILYVAKKRERLERTFEQMRGSVLRRMKNDRYEALSAAFVDKLREGTKIETLDGALEMYTPIPPSRPGASMMPAGGEGGPVGLQGAQIAQPGAEPVLDIDDLEREAREQMERDAREE